MIELGKTYKHYKGNTYKPLFFGKDSETMAEVVIYQNTEDYGIWVRPKKMWEEIVDNNGTLRFTLMEE